jgi:hypothetical protein
VHSCLLDGRPAGPLVPPGGSGHHTVRIALAGD